MEWDTSYVNFKYTKGREETTEQVWCVWFFSQCLTEPEDE